MPIIGVILLIGALIFAFKNILYVCTMKIPKTHNLNVILCPFALRVSGYVNFSVVENQQIHKTILW